MDSIKQRLQKYCATLISEELLEKALKDSKFKFEYKCAEDHLNQKTVIAFRQSGICRTCSRRDPEDSKKRFAEIVQRNGWTTDLTKYKNSTIEVEITCSCGKTWKAHPCAVLRNSVCPWCCSTSTEQTQERLKEKVLFHGGTVDMTKYKGCQETMLFKCKNGHEWETQPINVLQDCWCYDCLPQSPESMKKRLTEWVQGHGGKVLDINKYVNIITKMWFECEHKHQWETTPIIIFRSFKCRECFPGYKKRSTKEELIQKLTPAAEKLGLTFDPLKINTLSMDFTCPENHVWTAHPSCVLLGHPCLHCRNEQKEKEETALLEYVRRKGGHIDLTKRRREHKVVFSCHLEHKWSEIPAIILQEQSWCSTCIKQLTDRSKEELERKVKERGGTCCIDEYVDANTKMTFNCGTHTWKTRPDLIMANRWCGYCAQRSKAQAMQKLVDIVKERGGTVDISTYKTNHTSMRFTCHDSHPWFACPTSILNHSTWCPTCRQSSGERKISSILKRAEVPFLPQKKLEGTWLKADFFIEGKNLIIEFDGDQHFSLEWWGKQNLKFRVNDLKKNAWCVEHNIHLLRIPWWTVDVEKMIFDTFGQLPSTTLLIPPADYYGSIPTTNLIDEN